MRSSVRMQCISTCTPPVRQNSLPSSNQALSSMQFGQTQSMGYYGLQQKGFDEQSVRLRIPRTVSQPISSSANLQSNQTPQIWSCGSQSHLPYISPAFGRQPSPNNVPLASLQVGPHSVNLKHNPLAFNKTIQKNGIDLHSVQNVKCIPRFSVSSNVNGVSESNCRHGSNPPWQHPANRQNCRAQTTCQPAAQSQQAAFTTNVTPLTFNMNQGQMGGVQQYHETTRSAAHVPATSHVPVHSLLPSECRTSSSKMSQSQVRNALDPNPNPRYAAHFQSQVHNALDPNPNPRYAAHFQSQVHNALDPNPNPRYAAHFQSQVHNALDPNPNPRYAAHFQSQVQNALDPNPNPRYAAHFCQPLSHRNDAGYIELKHSSSQIPPLPYRARRNSAIQSQSNRRLDHVSPSLTQEKIQSQATSISGYHSETNFATFSAIQTSTQPQDLQSNTMNGLATNSQDITPFSTSTREKSSPSSHSGSKNYTPSLLERLLLQEDNSQSTVLTSFSNSFGSQSTESNSGPQQPTHHNTAGKKQGKARQGKMYKRSAKETGISRGDVIVNGSHVTEPQKSSQNETNWKKINEDVELNIDLADLQKQVNKVVAVVSPISQKASSQGQQNDVTTTTLDSLPLKTDKGDKETYLPNVTFKLTEDLPHVPSSPSSLPQLGSTIDPLACSAKMPTSENDPISGSQSCDISQCENVSVSTTQISSKCQDAVRIVGSTSRSSVEQNDYQEVESSSDNTTFDLSTVPVVDYTLKKLKDMVNSLEVKPTERDESTITDVMKCILDLYYDGDKQHLVKKLLASKELFDISSEFCVKEMHAVVLQHLVPKHLKMLENCSQILINETTLPFEDFSSSWLNVDGQTADVEKFLAEPISDHNLTWCKKVSQSESESVGNVVDSQVQIGTDNSENLGVHACKGIPKTTTDNIPEDILHTDPEHSTAIFATTDCKEKMKILEKGCRTPDELSRMQRKAKKQFTQQLHDEVDMVKENKPSLTSSTEKCKTNNSDAFEKADTSDEADSTIDLLDITVLSSEDARKILVECSKYSQKKEPNQIFHEERKDLVTHCVKNQSDSFKKKPLNDFKFTCPHATSLSSGNDFFCPSCWNETPLLDIDQDETLLTSKEGELNTDFQKQSSTLQSGKPIEYPSAPVYLESSSIVKSIISTPRPEGSDVMRDSNPGDQAQRSSPPPAQEPSNEIAGTKNSTITKPVAEDLQKIASSAATKSEDLRKEEAESQSGTKILTGMASLSCKNVKFHNTDAALKTNDIVLRPDIAIKNTSTHEQHPGDHRFMPRDDHQCRDESKESCVFQLSCKTKLGTPSQTPNVSGTPKCKNAVPHKQKKLIIKEKGQSKETQKVRLELYGNNSRRLSCRDDEKNSPSTPIYLTVSPIPNTGKNYTDEPSAKQKVYRQWSTTLIHPQRSSSSYKKSHKNIEDHLKSTIPTLKRFLKDRMMVISRKQSTEGLKHKQADAENNYSQDSKKLKNNC